MTEHAIRELKVGRFGPASGTVKSVVVFLHGYGANGADLLSLSEPLGEHLPDTLFLAPDGPEACSSGGFGRQWFPIPRFDGSSEAARDASVAQSARDIDAFLDGVLASEGLAPERLALAGFSQGSMMSLQVAPRRAAPIAGVVAFSGRLLEGEKLAAEARSKPPVLLLHGDQDPVVPFSSMAEAGEALVAAGFETYAHVERGTGHTIAPDGLGVALSFLKERLA